MYLSIPCAITILCKGGICEMAKYENRGYCPNNTFILREQHDGDENPFWTSIREILGCRLAYMVYDKAPIFENGYCYVVDALVGAKSDIMIEAAKAIRELTQGYEYPKDERPIVCEDVKRPEDIPMDIASVGDRMRLVHDAGSKDFGKISLYEDQRYVVAVADGGDTVNVYLYKK